MFLMRFLLFCITFITSNFITFSYTQDASSSSQSSGQSSNAQLASQISSTLSGAGSGVSSMFSGVAQMAGICTSGNTYTMSVWNDLNQPLAASLEKYVSVLGTKFAGKTLAYKLIPPFQNEQKAFNNIAVCHAVIRLATGITSSTAPDEDTLENNQIFQRPVDITSGDTNTYYYHAFTLNGEPNGEFLGPGMYGGPYSTSSDFQGVFFNNTPFDIQLSYSKNSQKYNVTLESDSFSLLSSDSTQTDSIRSATNARTFDFKLPNNTTTSIPISAQGLAQTYTDPTSQSTQTVPMTYTYEVVGSQSDNITVGIQGFNIGNHNQVGILDVASTETPTTLAKIRDINPVQCSIWYQSAEQLAAELAQSQNSNPALIPYNLNEQVWVSYATKDQVVQQQLTLGQVTSFTILRPQASEGTMNMYAFSIAPATAQAQQVQKFLALTADPEFLSKQQLSTNLQTLTSQSITTALAPASNAIITDKTTGLQAALVLTDSFVPYGAGNVTPRYYVIKPALIQADSSFASVLTTKLDPAAFTSSSSQSDQSSSDLTQAQDAMYADFTKNIAGWLTTFNQNKANIAGSTITVANLSQYGQQLEALVPDLTNYIKQKGLATLFNNPTDSADQRTFNQTGLQALYFMLLGPVSLNNPPVLRQAGSNVYLSGGKPQDWPGSTNS